MAARYIPNFNMVSQWSPGVFHRQYRRLSDGCHVVIMSNILKTKIDGILATVLLGLLLM